jgi:hypothetical protein
MTVKPGLSTTMPILSRKSLELFAFAIVLASPATAQEPESARASDTTIDRPSNRWVSAPTLFGAWVAGAHNSEFRTRTGIPGRRDFYLGAVRLGWSVRGYDPSRVANLQYFIDVVPFAVSTGMPDYVWDRRCRPGFMCPGASPITHTVHAFGITPIGWSLSLGGQRARLNLEASGGGLWFARRVPDPEATRFNFTASAGPSLNLAVGPSSSLRVGYLWHHTSNGGTGRINPGLDSGILSVGLFYHAHRSETVTAARTSGGQTSTSAP